jgi:hypothetical protein
MNSILQFLSKNGLKNKTGDLILQHDKCQYDVTILTVTAAILLLLQPPQPPPLLPPSLLNSHHLL